MCHVIMGKNSSNTEQFRDNIIFLCSPKTNPTLMQLAPSIPLSFGYKVDLARGTEDTPSAHTIGNIKLPVWFGSRWVVNGAPANPNSTNETQGKDKQEKPWEQKVICLIPQHGLEDGKQLDVLISQAEDDYIRAERLGDYTKLEDSPGKKEDMALIIRADPGLFDNGQPDNTGHKVIVIAGIHQYGTWIAGDFIENFCKGKRPEVDNLFTSEEDFAVVVYGRFNDQNITVEWSEVHLQDAWRFNGKSWEAYEIKKERTVPSSRL